MAGGAIEHHTEIEHAPRSVRTVAVLAVAAALALLLVWSLRSDRSGPAASPTTLPSPTTTAPTGVLPEVHVVADTDAGPRPATTAQAPGASSEPGAGGFEAVQATPVVTDGRVVVLVDGGTVMAGRPGSAFAPVGLDAPSSALVASNEPGHVWVVTPDGTLALVDLDGTDPPVQIPLDGDRVVGPASFGVVTVSDDGTTSWRRPSFDPAVVAIPEGRPVVDAGGDLVLVRGSDGPGGEHSFELWSVVDGSIGESFTVATDLRAPALATDGSSVALPHAAGWVVRDAATGEQRGSLPAAPGGPVWIGDGRFAVLVDGQVAVSDGTRLAPPWRLRALAEQSP